jgi:hypothetical protein
METIRTIATSNQVRAWQNGTPPGALLVLSKEKPESGTQVVAQESQFFDVASRAWRWAADGDLVTGNRLKSWPLEFVRPAVTMPWLMARFTFTISHIIQPEDLSGNRWLVSVNPNF